MVGTVKEWGFTWFVKPQSFTVNGWESRYGYPALGYQSEGYVTICAYASPDSRTELAALVAYPNHEHMDFIGDTERFQVNEGYYDRDLDELLYLENDGCITARQFHKRAYYLVTTDQLNSAIFDMVIARIKEVEKSPMPEPAVDDRNGFCLYKKNYYISLADFFRKHPGYTAVYESLWEDSDIVAVFGYFPSEAVFWNRDNGGFPCVARLVDNEIKEV